MGKGLCRTSQSVLECDYKLVSTIKERCVIFISQNYYCKIILFTYISWSQVVEVDGFLSQFKMTQIINTILEKLGNTYSDDYLIHILIDGALCWHHSAE